jgi:hypothetical protein
VNWQMRYANCLFALFAPPTIFLPDEGFVEDGVGGSVGLTLARGRANLKHFEVVSTRD